MLGGLVGWLASWWLGRKRAVTVERVVEKIVDRPVEVIVEKPVDNPVHLDRIRALEAQVAQTTPPSAEVVRSAAPLMNASVAQLEMPPVPSTVQSPDPDPAPVAQKPSSKIMDRALEKAAREASK